MNGDPGGREMAWMRKALITPAGPQRGKAFELLDHEIEFLRAIYRPDPPVRRAILSTPRKNRKTTLCAAITLCHLAGPRAQFGTSLVSTAQALDQAALIYDEACRLMSKSLSAHVKRTPSRKWLEYAHLETQYRALSAEAKSKLGKGPIFAIHDELGEVQGPVFTLYDAVETGMVHHDRALSIIISTQAANDDDLLSGLIDDQLAEEDDNTVLKVHTAPEGCEIDDRDAWRIANPALGTIVKEEKLAEAVKSAKKAPEHISTFRRYHLNQRVAAGVDGALRWMASEERQADWEACEGPVNIVDAPSAGPEPQVEKGLKPRVYGGLDLSESRDLTCLVWAWRPKDWTPPADWAPPPAPDEEPGPPPPPPIHLQVRTFLPDYNLVERCRQERIPWARWADLGLIDLCPGKIVDYELVADAIVEAERDWDLVQLRYDRYRMPQLVRIMEPVLGQPWIDDHCEEMGQGWKSMSPALGDFEELLASRGVVHAGHPVLSVGARQARVWRNKAGSRQLTRINPRHKIDGVVAALMAVAALQDADPGLKPLTGDEVKIWSF